MSLSNFIVRLDVAQFDVDAGQVLDALWLASLACDLSLHAAAVPRSEQPAPAPEGEHDTGAEPAPKPPAAAAAPATTLAPRLAALPDIDIFPVIDAPPSPTTLRASPVALPAPRALANRLALTRALRPFSQRWPSHQYAEIDEERTAESCIRVGANKSHLVLPVFKPRREHWFDVDLVVEDEPSVVLWDAMLREFAELMRETGAFASVRQWRLRMGENGRPASLENAIGIRVTTGSLLGKAARRLVVFASTGTSPRWTDGSNAKVLAPWLHDNSVVLLQLTAPERWARSAIGEPQAMTSTTTAGAESAVLNVQAHWWKLTRDRAASASLPLPVITLSHTSLGRWASMQMARGQASPAYLMKTAQVAASSPSHGTAAPDVGRAVALLKYESPNIFRLAVFLSTGPFTLTVARLVQAIKFAGSTDPDMLAELIRSGLVVAVTSGTRSDEAVFSVRPQARDLLLRSLRDSEATQLARDLERELSQHISSFSGSGVRSSQLIADEDGKHHLPEWAKPFASLATSLLGLPVNVHAAQHQLEAFFGAIDQATVQAIARLAASSQLLQPSAFVPAIWDQLLTARLVFRRDDGTWAFAPYVRQLFAEKQRAPTQTDADWLEAALALLQSMALSFRIGHIVGAEGGRRIPEQLPSWVGERATALEHWMAVSENLFWKPVRTVLITGEDPCRHRDPVADRAAFDNLLQDWQIRARVQASAVRSGRVPAAVPELRNAVRLLAEREPERIEELTLFGMEDPVRDFISDPPFSFGDDERWQRNERAILEWLGTNEVADAVALYCSPFFQAFATHGASSLALSKNYAHYIASLIKLWKDASEELFSTQPLHQLAMDHAVAEDSLRLVAAHYPAILIERNTYAAQVAAERTPGNDVKWLVKPADYLALISGLGKVLVDALHERLALAPRRPRVLWVDGSHSNNTTQRKYGLAEGKLEYTLASTTDEGLAHARNALFDMVLSDMTRHHDRAAGFTLLEALRRTGNKVPFVIYSSSSKPGDDEEARKRGAVGRTGTAQQLPVLVQKALMAREAVLERPLTIESMLQYATWRYPGMRQDTRLAKPLVEDLDALKYPTLLEIDQAVTRTWDAVALYVADSDLMKDSANGRLIVALCMVDPVVDKRFGGESGGIATKYLQMVRGNGRAALHETPALDQFALSDKLQEQLDDEAVLSFKKGIEAALVRAIETADWIAEGNSYLAFETDDEYAEFISWDFVSSSAFFEPTGYDDGTLYATSSLAVLVEAHCRFNFSARDSIDKDMLPLGHLRASRKIRFQANAKLAFSGIEAGKPALDFVEFEHIVQQVDFGNVEPLSD